MYLEVKNDIQEACILSSDSACAYTCGLLMLQHGNHLSCATLPAALLSVVAHFVARNIVMK
eukprot:m.81654 g.81654  ORF g.81654 m.81654 type:complete len:61 (+) comp36241_c0_seq3:1299-1481(+)